MNHLFSVWDDISERIKATDQILLLSDFDGTLSPIVGRPEEAVLPDDTRQVLERLAHHQKVAVAVISGRSLRDLKSRVGIQGITCAGNHGIEIEGPWCKFVYPPAEALRPVIHQLYSILSRDLTGFEGAFVEDKGFTLTVHYRLARENRVDELRRICEETVRRLRSEGRIRTTEGKKVYEIRPGALWDKEDAMGLIMSGWSSSTGKSNSLAIFLGDDLTDEGGFKAVNGLGGITVLTGQNSRESSANYFLRSVEEVTCFLDRLFSHLR